MALTVNIRGGTRGGKRFLCETCSNCTFIKGVAESQESYYCTYIEKPVHMRVVECTTYRSVATRDVREMEAAAWIIETKRGRIIGFTSPEDFRRNNDGRGPNVEYPDLKGI